MICILILIGIIVVGVIIALVILLNSKKPIIAGPRRIGSTRSALIDTPDGRIVNGYLPATDQYNCNSCWAIATCQCISDRMHLMGRLAPGDQLNYIAYHDMIVAQTPDVDGCATGALINTGMDMMVSYGAPLKSETADRVFDDTHLPNDMNARRIKVKGWKKIKSTNAIKKELETSGTVVGIINLYDSFQDFVGSSPYVPLGSERPDSAMAHMVSIVGYDDADHTWIIRNSYGLYFGFNGLAKVRQGDRKLDLESDVYAPIM